MTGAVALGVSLAMTITALIAGWISRFIFYPFGLLAWLVIVIMLFFFPFPYLRVLFDSGDLVDIYRKRRFGQVFCLYAGLGFVAGFGIAFAISERPGVLLARDYDFYRTVILFVCGMAFVGPMFSLMHVLLFNTRDMSSVATWIREWKKSLQSQAAS